MLFSYVAASECTDGGGGEVDREERYDVLTGQLQLGLGRGIEMELNYSIFHINYY